MKISPSGQALVEYALILVLVAIAVIAVLALLGPSIAKAINNVINPLNPQWTFCSNEYENCTISSTRQVRYGKNGHWVYRTLTTSFDCNNSIFGDPLVGTVKECDIQ